MVAAVAHPHVVCGLGRMDVVVGLLSHHRHMRRLIGIVSTATVLVCIVVFKCQARRVAGAHESSRPYGLALQKGYLGIAVGVVVISVAVTALSIHHDTGVALVGHHRGVHRGVVVQTAENPHRSECMRYLRGVRLGILGDYVYRATYGRRPEKRRTATTHHLYALYHIRWDMLQTIYSRKSGKYRTGIHQYL